MNDLISRQAAIDALHMHLMYRMGTDSNKRRLDDWINGVPSVQPEVIRCKECKHRPHKTEDGYTRSPRVQVGVYAWGDPEYDDDLTCPYVCEDTWYSCVPDDEQYCDRAERMETES